MNTFSFALFLHIIGALMLFAALALEWVGLRQIRSEKLSEPVRAWLGVLGSISKVGFISMLTTVITGVYMLTVWGWTSWLVVTVGALVLMIVLTRAVAPRVKALGQSLEAVNDPILWISIQTRVVIVLGIVFLKIAKPNLVGSLLTIGVAVVLGIASALLMSRRQAPSQAISTD